MVKIMDPQVPFKIERTTFKNNFRSVGQKPASRLTHGGQIANSLCAWPTKHENVSFYHKSFI